VFEEAERGFSSREVLLMHEQNSQRLRGGGAKVRVVGGEGGGLDRSLRRLTLLRVL